MTYNIPSHISGDTWKGIGSISFTRGTSSLNLSGYKIEAGFKLSIASPIVLFLTTDNGGINIVSESSGTISIPSRIVDIPIGNYTWYLTLISPANERKTYLMGLWEIIPNVPVAY